MRRRWRLGTLRTRITALLVLVLLAATAVIGVVTALSLRAFLVDRLDAQLGAAGGRFSISLEFGDGDQDDDGDDAVPGQAVGTLGVRLLAGRVAQSAVVDPGGVNVAPSFTTADVQALRRLPVGGRARTIDFDRLGDYRLQAVAGRDGDVQITGLPQRDVDATIARLISVESVVFAAVIALAAVIVAVLVRRTMRPLERVADVACHVADLPLTEAATPLPSGLAPAQPTTEVDQVSTAFEHMIDHIRAALAARDATEERLRQFVADASHEFRTPLATIRANSESAQRDRGALTPEMAETLGRIDAATGRMSALVEDLLLLARLDDDRTRQVAPTDLTRLVVEAVVDARALAPDHHWRLDLPDDPVVLPADSDHLHRVVVNLLSNARRHTPAGTRVEVSLFDDGCGTVTLVVADDGPGIPLRLQGSLFDRFTRGDTSRSSAGGSTGLGLAIAHGVVGAHGGTLVVASVPGDTAFTARLPYAADQGEDSSGCERPPDRGPNLSKVSESG